MMWCFWLSMDLVSWPAYSMSPKTHSLELRMLPRSITLSMVNGSPFGSFFSLMNPLLFCKLSVGASNSILQLNDCRKWLKLPFSLVFFNTFVQFSVLLDDKSLMPYKWAVLIMNLKSNASRIRMSAGLTSPSLTITKSPTSSSSHVISSFCFVYTLTFSIKLKFCASSRLAFRLSK